MSVGGKKEKSKSTTVVTPSNPSWVTGSLQGYTGGLDALSRTDPKSYVAQTNPLMKRAQEAAMGLNLGQGPMTLPEPGGAGDSAFAPEINRGPGDGYNPKGATVPTTGGGLTASPSSFFDTAGLLGLAGATGGPNLAGPAQTYTASGPVQVNGYTPATAGSASVGRTSISPVERITAGQFAGTDLTPYYNSGLNDMISAAEADYDTSAGRARADASRIAAMNGGSRNSGNSIRDAVLEGELSRARNSGLADLRYNAFNSAAGLAVGDIDRRFNADSFNAGSANQRSLAQAQIDANRAGQNAQFQQQSGIYNASAQNDALSQLLGLNTQAGLDYAGRQDQAGQFGANANNQRDQFNAGQRDASANRLLQAGGIFGNLGTAYGQDVRSNIGLLGDLGSQQQEIDQATAAAPLTLQQILGGLYSGVPFGLFNGSTTTGNSSTGSLGFSADLMKLAALMPKSDVRAKTDIVPLGEGPGGVPAYEFSYADDPTGTRYVGPMAQEVAQAYPQGVGQAPDGMMTVDYNALGFPTPDQQDRSGLSAMRTRAAASADRMAANDAAPVSMRRKRGLFGGR